MRVAALFLLGGGIWAQSGSSAAPRFEDYPAGAAFTGAAVGPRLITPLQQSFAEQIRDGVEKGYGVFRNGKEQKGPNFAGDFIVVKWGCGAPCLRMAIVDARNGEVHYPPISSSGIDGTSFDLPLLRIGNSVPQNPEVEFRLSSSLMIVRATPNQRGGRASYSYYFLWRQNRWTLLKRVSLNKR